MKMLVSLREEWKEKFDPDYGPREFEMEHEEEERFRASQRYAADTISRNVERGCTAGLCQGFQREEQDG